MFTGIVEELGEVVAVDAGDGTARLAVSSVIAASDARPGDSIAVNGVCLTVTALDPAEPPHTGGARTFSADVMLETLTRSGLGALRAGSPVNLERPLSLSSRLGGHLVQGHVDGLGAVLDRRRTPSWDVVRIALPEEIERYVVEKGSITVDGISLTVASVEPGSFTVSLIPTTLAGTTLGTTPVGGTVNLEVDVLAKYVERLLGHRAAPGTGSATTTPVRQEAPA